MRQFLFFITAILTPTQTFAQVTPLERTYAERVAMRVLDQKCNLFDVGPRRALGGFTAQARGGALRAGISQGQLSLVANQATQAAAAKPCTDATVRGEAARVIAAHKGWRAQMTGAYPGTLRTWLVDRTGKDSWRAVQELGNGLRAGFVASPTGLSFALETPGTLVSGARLYLRDASRIGWPSAGQRLVVPLRVGTTAYVAGTIRAADTKERIGLPSRTGTMLVFNDEATRAVILADPRDSFEVEIIERNGRVVRAIVEVGDVVAAFAFAAEF
jgi:hypothetical protein